MKLFSVILIVLVAGLAFAENKDYKVFCYWGSWSYYYTSPVNFRPWNTNPNLCTHLVYAFFGVDNLGKIKILDHYLDIYLNAIQQIVNQRKLNRNLKVLASIGGWHEGSIKFSDMALSDKRRGVFVGSVLKFIKKWHFDGIDLNWQYPAQRDGIPADRENFILLLEKLSLMLHNRKKILSVVVSPDALSMQRSYKVIDITTYADFVNLLTFDLYGPWDRKLGHNAPLYTDSNEMESVSSTTLKWITECENPEKVLLGIPFYGHTFTVMNASQISLGARCRGGGFPGQYTKQSGFLTYNEFCTQASKWKRNIDGVAKVPYAYRGNQWISYENERSIFEKLKFAKEQKMGGAMIWTIDMDDFNGICGKAYPLLEAVNVALGRTVIGWNAENYLRESPGACRTDGIFIDEVLCSRYFKCHDGERENYECPLGEYFDEKLKKCNLAKLTNCRRNYTYWKPTMNKFGLFDFPVNLRII